MASGFPKRFDRAPRDQKPLSEQELSPPFVMEIGINKLMSETSVRISNLVKTYLDARGRLESAADKYLNKEIVLGIRPEYISNEPPDVASVAATLSVQTSEPMGSESLVYFKAGSGSLIARIQGDHIFHLGEKVTVRLDLDKVTFFDPSTENVIN
jgi:ABC-type sugar transport system ATPase subunit